MNSPDNPYDILNQTPQWVNHGYHNGHGSLFGLANYAKRRKLYAELQNNQTPAVQLKVFKYLLNLEGDPDVS